MTHYVFVNENESLPPVSHFAPYIYPVLPTYYDLTRPNPIMTTPIKPLLKPRERRIHNPLSLREQKQVMRLQSKFGNRWVLITKYLPGRTTVQIKNFWNSKKRRAYWGDSSDDSQDSDYVGVDQNPKQSSLDILCQVALDEISV